MTGGLGVKPFWWVEGGGGGEGWGWRGVEWKYGVGSNDGMIRQFG